VAADWKMGNLGTHPDGRTILLDWAFPGAGPARWDLCRYLALNRARLPRTEGGRDQPVPGLRWKTAASTPGAGGSNSSTCA
jgi:hypothetical protein